MADSLSLSSQQLETLITQTDSVESLLTSIDSRLSSGLSTVVTFPDNEPFNIAQYGGTAVGVGNAFYVRPGTDAAFTFSLPTGAATSAKQDTLLTELQLKADLTETQPVSLASVPSHAVTNSGTFVVQENGAALTALQLIDNAISGAGFNITQFGGASVPIGAGTEVTAVRVTLPTDGTGVVKLGAGTAEIGKLAAGTANIGDIDILTIAAGDNNIGNVDIVTLPNVVIGSGTVTTVSTLTNQSQEGGVNISLNAGAVDTGTRRVVQANGAGKTILSTGGSAASSGNNTLVAAGTNRLKVCAFSLTTTSATAMTCIFQSGAGGTELWRCIIMAPSGANSGANLSTAVPGWLFATASATLLNLNLSSANAVHWSVSYFDEA